MNVTCTGTLQSCFHSDRKQSELLSSTSQQVLVTSLQIGFAEIQVYELKNFKLYHIHRIQFIMTI